MALASAFVGLARHVGLDARYIDASSRVHETRYGEDGTTVNFGHVTAMVMTGQEKIGLDFEQVGPFTWYRVLDDLEALAHFYNNRGYEAVDGRKTVEQLIDEFAAREKLTFFESRALLGQYFQTLVRRGVIVATLPSRTSIA